MLCSVWAFPLAFRARQQCKLPLRLHMPRTLLQERWSWTLSMESAIIFTLRLLNSGASFAARPSSVVQTGVKSRGWEKRMPHLKEEGRRWR